MTLSIANRIFNISEINIEIFRYIDNPVKFSHINKISFANSNIDSMKESYIEILKMEKKLFVLKNKLVNKYIRLAIRKKAEIFYVRFIEKINRFYDKYPEIGDLLVRYFKK